MSIISNSKTKILCQGILTPMGLIHTEQAITYGSNIVGGIASGKKDQTILGVPLFETLEEACATVHPDMTIIFSSPTGAAEEIEKAINAQIKWIICPVERIPVHDILRIKDKLKKSKSRLIGPAAPGIITAGECKAGTMPAHLFLAGNVGIMSRSSSLMYEAVQQLKNKGIGVSTCVALGAYPILGTEFSDILDLFNRDKKTDLILLIGEIGGAFEQKLASYYASRKKKKPLVAYIGGHFVPRQVYMGNIGAIVNQDFESADDKTEKLKQAGAIIASSPATIGDAVFKTLTQERKK